MVETLQHHYMYVCKRIDRRHWKISHFRFLLWWWIDRLRKYCNSILFLNGLAAAVDVFSSHSPNRCFFFCFLSCVKCEASVLCVLHIRVIHFHRTCDVGYLTLNICIEHWRFCDRRKHDVARLTMQNVYPNDVQIHIGIDMWYSVLGARCYAEGHFPKKSHNISNCMDSHCRSDSAKGWTEIINTTTEKNDRKSMNRFGSAMKRNVSIFSGICIVISSRSNPATLCMNIFFLFWIEIPNTHTRHTHGRIWISMCACRKANNKFFCLFIIWTEVSLPTTIFTFSCPSNAMFMCARIGKKESLLA